MYIIVLDFPHHMKLLMYIQMQHSFQSQLLDFLFPDVKNDWLPTDFVSNDQTISLVKAAIERKQTSVYIA